MKKIMLMVVSLVLVTCLSSMTIFASEDSSNTTYETDQGIIQYYDDFIEGYEAKCELIRENTIALGGDPEKELIVDNCVVVRSKEDLEFDTSHVIAAVRYGKNYYIRYDSVEAAEEAVVVFQTYPSVTAVGRDSFDPGGWELYEADKIKYYDDFIEGYEARCELMRENTIALGGDPDKELIVNNCVIVNTWEPIEIDTSHVLAGVRYYRTYYIRYDSVEAAETAVAEFQEYPSVTVAGCDGFDSSGYWELYDDTLTFSDVQPDNWYYEVIRDITATGYMTGMNAEYFGAVKNMQRQDVAVVLYRMAGSPTVAYHTVFPDVSSNPYYASAAVWAYDNGIVEGQNGYLGVGKYITRQDFITILFRYAELLGLDTTARASLNEYTDAAQVSSWALEPMQWAVANGLIGLNVTALNPANNAVRAEIAAIVMRFLTFAKEE